MAEEVGEWWGRLEGDFVTYLPGNRYGNYCKGTVC